MGPLFSLIFKFLKFLYLIVHLQLVINLTLSESFVIDQDFDTKFAHPITHIQYDALNRKYCKPSFFFNQYMFKKL